MALRVIRCSQIEFGDQRRVVGARIVGGHRGLVG